MEYWSVVAEQTGCENYFSANSTYDPTVTTVVPIIAGPSTEPEVIAIFTASSNHHALHLSTSYPVVKLLITVG